MKRAKRMKIGNMPNTYRGTLCTHEVLVKSSQFSAIHTVYDPRSDRQHQIVQARLSKMKKNSWVPLICNCLAFPHFQVQTLTMPTHGHVGELEKPIVLKL